MGIKKWWISFSSFRGAGVMVPGHRHPCMPFKAIHRMSSAGVNYPKRVSLWPSGHKGVSLSLLNLKELRAEAAVLLCEHEEPVEIDSISDTKILKTFEEAQRRWKR